ncbi:hypothetical protein [Prescottella equi]|uniref:hypothetical protein n=1 Tax=Rhodococcus hoagii TaxID=43767 RepID=UPI000D101D38|nr:hypothetical protein [Prescottella equi]AVP71310.1 hypothetical protein C7H75_24825 [Prescottella equi]
MTTPNLPATLDENIRWCTNMAKSSMLPRQYQEQPANLLFALEYADALGVSRMSALTSIHVIEGKPSASADLIAALIRRAGHRLRVSGDDHRAVAELIRADDPDFTFKVEWTMARAQAAQLTGKAMWKKYPAAMLRSRAISEIGRMGASDVLMGMIYTPEELGAVIDESGEAVLDANTGTVQMVQAVAERTDSPQQQAQPQQRQQQPQREREVHKSGNEALGAALGDQAAAEDPAAVEAAAAALMKRIEESNDVDELRDMWREAALLGPEHGPAAQQLAAARVEDVKKAWEAAEAKAAENAQQAVQQELGAENIQDAETVDLPNAAAAEA